jgi:hypothetical protein
MSETPGPISLCRYEELAQRENRLREARASGQVTAAEQLPCADDLEGQGVDVPDGLSSGELNAGHPSNGVGPRTCAKR